MARYKKVNPGAVWEYFQEVIAPEVLELQGQRTPEEMTLGALTLAFVQAAPLSEVTIIIFHKWGSVLNLIVSQVLQVVNPSVSYTTHTGHPSTADKTRYQGVAISLKEFVRAIDNSVQLRLAQFFLGESVQVCARLYARICLYPIT